MKHTPGPWVAHYNGVGSHVVYTADGSAQRICEMQQGELEANANLIAEAPDMLKALIYAKETMAIECPHYSTRIIDEVIKRATSVRSLFD